MRTTLDSTLAWWIAGPILGLVILSFLALANKRFGVVGGVTDLVRGSDEGRGLHSWRSLGGAATPRSGSRGSESRQKAVASRRPGIRRPMSSDREEVSDGR